MKKTILSLGVMAMSMMTFTSYAQTDCTGGRYNQAMFTNVTTTSDIQYGKNFKRDGITNEDLFLDIYTPQGDNDNNRPVVLLAHGGSFIGGTKTDLAALCTNLAKMGYVAVSMEYRLLSTADLGAIMGNKEQGFKEEVVRAIHDMKAAIRFMRKSYENGNPYGINPNLILAGGQSAGALIADHLAYMDKDSKIPTELVNYFAEQGGMEGNSGNPGYSSKPQMVLSMCGAIMDTVFIDSPTQQPFYGVHTMEDQVVPPLFGQPNIGLPVAVDLYGDSLIFMRAQHVGLTSKYKNYPTGAHCQFGADYFADMTGFMHEMICLQGLATKDNADKMLASVYPNPASSTVTIDIPGNIWTSEVSIVDLTGKVVYTAIIPEMQNVTNLDIRNLNAGIYQVMIHTNDGRSTMKKVVIE